MKIFHLGRRIDGRFDSLKTWLKRTLKQVSILSFIGLALYGAYQLGEFDKTVYAQPTPDALEVKIDTIKNELLTTLQVCESNGHNEEDGIIIFDTNNKASIGQFQFQKATVIHYYKTLYNQDITSKDAVIIALDTAKARQLASDIMFTTDKGYTNWLNCSNRYNFPATLKVINMLEAK